MTGRIISIETSAKNDAQCLIKSVRDQSTEAALQENYTSTKAFPRIVSASYMLPCATQENGPKENQVSRGVSTAGKDILKRRTVFRVLNESSLEEEFKGKVDYDDLVLIRAKVIEEKPESKENKLPVLQELFKDTLKEEKMPCFLFSQYGDEILKTYQNR